MENALYKYLFYYYYYYIVTALSELLQIWEKYLHGETFISPYQGTSFTWQDLG